MIDDEILAVRKARHEISTVCGHDVHKVAVYCRTVGERVRQAAKERSKPPVSHNLRRVQKPKRK